MTEVEQTAFYDLVKRYRNTNKGINYTTEEFDILYKATMCYGTRTFCFVKEDWVIREDQVCLLLTKENSGFIFYIYTIEGLLERIGDDLDNAYRSNNS